MNTVLCKSFEDSMGAAPSYPWVTNPRSGERTQWGSSTSFWAPKVRCPCPVLNRLVGLHPCCSPEVGVGSASPKHHLTVRDQCPNITGILQDWVTIFGTNLGIDLPPFTRVKNLPTLASIRINATVALKLQSCQILKDSRKLNIRYH